MFSSPLFGFLLGVSTVETMATNNHKTVENNSGTAKIDAVGDWKIEIITSKRTDWTLTGKENYLQWLRMPLFE